MVIPGKLTPPPLAASVIVPPFVPAVPVGPVVPAVPAVVKLPVKPLVWVMLPAAVRFNCVTAVMVSSTFSGPLPASATVYEVAAVLWYVVPLTVCDPSVTPVAPLLSEMFTNPPAALAVRVPAAVLTAEPALPTLPADEYRIKLGEVRVTPLPVVMPVAAALVAWRKNVPVAEFGLLIVKQQGVVGLTT
jgi:hypothetical protein